MMRGKVAQLVEEVLEENKSLFLIDLSISEANKITVILDGDNGVTVADCMLVSRAIEHNIDREEHDFSLEVMSSGVSEPLKLPRQYKKNLGRTLKVKNIDGTVTEGEITQVDEETVSLKWKAREPKPVGKGKITVEKTAVIPYKDIVEAKVMVKFN
jgi:ribosome maturation factor RimP